jgi:hypothetical protein
MWNVDGAPMIPQQQKTTAAPHSSGLALDPCHRNLPDCR